MLYVYAIAADDRAAGEDGLPRQVSILPGAPVLRVACADLLAIVSPVPTGGDFSPEALPARLEDVGWMRDRVLAHEQVISALLPVFTVLPLKFGTLFSDEAQLQSAVHQHRAALEEVLALIRDAQEWGVKIFYDPQRLGSCLAARRPPTAAAAGAAFFQRKREELQMQQEAADRIAHCVAASHRRLAEHARAAVANPLQPAAMHRAAGEMALNGAYLVVRADQAIWHERVRELERAYADEGVRFVVTGPWGAYNFARLTLG